MNEWLYEEVAELERADRERKAGDARLNLRRQHTDRIWDTLRLLIKDATEQLNQIPQLKQKTGGLDCVSGYSDRIEVTKSDYPAIYLTVRRGPTSIDLHRKVVTNGSDRQTQEQAESLEVELDNGGSPYLRSEDGTKMITAEAVRYIFKPFIYPETLKLKRPLRLY